MSRGVISAVMGLCRSHSSWCYVLEHLAGLLHWHATGEQGRDTGVQSATAGVCCCLVGLAKGGTGCVGVGAFERE